MSLTGSDDAATAIEAARISVAGYIRKDQRLSAIAEALNRAAAGEPWVDASVMKRLRSPQSNGTTRRHPVDDLTRQERVVLAMLEEGLSPAEIVRRMGIGNSTVRSHIQAILTTTASIRGSRRSPWSVTSRRGSRSRTRHEPTC